MPAAALTLHYDPFADLLTVTRERANKPPRRVAVIKRASEFAGADAPGAAWAEPLASLLTGWARGWRARAQFNVASLLDRP